MLLDPGSGCASPLSIDGVAFGVVTWSTSRFLTVQVGQTVLDCYIVGKCHGWIHDTQVEMNARSECNMDNDRGMWMVSPDFNHNGEPNLAVIHIDSIFCVAHLVLIFKDSFIPDNIMHHNSLDSFKGFYVNHFINHHVFDIAS